MPEDFVLTGEILKLARTIAGKTSGEMVLQFRNETNKISSAKWSRIEKGHHDDTIHAQWYELLKPVLGLEMQLAKEVLDKYEEAKKHR